MKVILSRKGFDSSAGGCANPILPDGQVVSFPIPSDLDTLSYADLRSPCGRSYLQLLTELGCPNTGGRGAHYDPQLERPRGVAAAWRGTLGQIGAAAGHLRNQKVQSGDLFLFYGWFRHTVELEGQLKFTRDPGIHLIWGYLQVAEVLPLGPGQPIPAWLNDHPHAHPARRAKSTNTVYVGRKTLSFDARRPGSGVLPFDARRVLTAPGLPRTCWRLDPAIFRDVQISYHDASAWRAGYFRSYPRAQEYVIGATPAVCRWAVDRLAIDH